ncbi:hypothetical protein chiPu_0022184 [Chiloscyllium punctatum]|uniref:Uncharacterized protein n=1 Tax=Chiloscyllium punctatum TaxID=137246 RepID=A0A401RDX2_CHIPU|nr:hypothetical protein [Chiloscyllium punctatum]
MAAATTPQSTIGDGGRRRHVPARQRHWSPRPPVRAGTGVWLARAAARQSVGRGLSPNACLSNGRDVSVRDACSASRPSRWRGVIGPHLCEVYSYWPACPSVSRDRPVHLSQCKGRPVQPILDTIGLSAYRSRRRR